MKFKEYDVIIVGTGVSGLYAALNLDSSMQILMLSKRELTLCNSALAQGGVAAVMDTSNDNYELHIKDTLISRRLQEQYRQCTHTCRAGSEGR